MIVAKPLWSVLALGVCGLLAGLRAQEPQQGRDLSVKTVPATPAPAPAPTQHPLTVPRSYALVIGIAKYQNLAPAQNLQFSERDADSMYSILISPEGGNFHAENVHRLTGSRRRWRTSATNSKNWLPSVAKDDDRVLIYFAGHGFVIDGRALPGALRYPPGQHHRHRLSHGDAGLGDRRQDSRQVEGAAHRRLP